MGHIKATELSNGNIGLEITYGGKECPFGGVDTSAPPAYIDPKCFTDCNGFLIVNNQLVAVNMAPADAPPLWGGVYGVQLIGFGNFYSTKYGTLNYALGYKAIAIGGTPTGVQYTFYMTAWSPSNPATHWDDTLVETLYNSLTPATAASITMALAATSSTAPGSGASFSIVAITELTSITTDDYYFKLKGIIASLSLYTAGSNYAVGSTYWIAQDSNVTAQISITAVNGTGGITGFTLVPDSYTTTYIDTTYEGVPVSVSCVNYTVGTINATLYYVSTSDVVLAIAGPNGSNKYSVTSNGISQEAPTLAGDGAWFYVEKITQNGNLIDLFTLVNGPAFLDVAIVSVNILDGGTGYNVGEEYILATGYTDPSASRGYSFTPNNTLDTNAYVKIRVTEVGIGGSITKLNLISTGVQDSYLPAPIIFNYYVVGAYEAASLNTETSSISYILDTIASEINGTADAPYDTPDPNVSATVISGSSSLELVALAAGVGGNSISVQDLSTITGPNLYYYYFPVRTLTYLTGGSDGSGTSTTLSTTLPTQASIASAGGTLYIGNIGPIIIKYSGPGVFVVSSTYQGVRVLRKFAGSLFGLGVIPAPNTVLDSTDMMITWTEANALDVWNPVNIDSNITGAGFEQLSDIGDYLTGLVVTSATAFILRAQGISYATATGNATNPFNISHIGLGDQGEGAQVAALVCQYDQTGAYIGNTEVYKISNSIAPIGAKIKAMLLSEAGSGNLTTSAASSVFLGGDSFPAAAFIVSLESSVYGTLIYLYNVINGTWMYCGVPLKAQRTVLLNGLLGVLASANTFASTAAPSNARLTLAYQKRLVAIHPIQAPTFWVLSEGIATNRSLSVSAAATVTFVQEEIAFGRDVTIDGLYVALLASVLENVVIDFYVSGIYFNSLTLTPTQFNTLDGVPVELRLTSATGAFTVHSPQLSYNINQLSTAETSMIRFTKFAMFGSFDQKQRPV